MLTPGERLREERARLGFSQTAFAARCGVTKVSQINYEKGERAPDSNYLKAAAETGADIQYILTGVRSVNLHQVADERGTYRAEKKGAVALSRDEEALVEKYRHLKPADRNRLHAIGDALAESEVKEKKKPS